MRGSTAASRTPIAMTPPENPTGPPISGSARSASSACPPFRYRGVDQREDEPVDDLVDRLAGRDRPAQVGAGLFDVGDRGRSPLPGSSMVAVAKPSRCGALSPADQPGVHVLQAAGVTEQDQRHRRGCRMRMRTSTGCQESRRG